MGSLSAGLLVIAGLIVIYRLALGRGLLGRSRTSSLRGGGPKQRKQRSSMLRTSTGPMRYSNRSVAVLWVTYVLTMALGANIVMDLAKVVSVLPHVSSTGSTTILWAGILLAALACLLAVLFALPGNMSRRSEGGAQAVVLAAADMVLAVGAWSIHQTAGAGLDVLVVAIAVVILCGHTSLGSRLLVQIGAVAITYGVMQHYDGDQIVTLSTIMTVLMGTLTMLLVVARRSRL